MARDERIVVFGEDVADCSNEENLEQGEREGRRFQSHVRIAAAFGSERVFNSPIAEANIVGRAMGMAARGLKPVAEIQFFDYIWPAMMQLRNELAMMRWRSAERSRAPAVIRVAIGGYLTGGAIYHSQCGEVLFTHTPGVRVVMPSTALDVCGFCAPRFAATIPCCFSSTNICTASRTIARRIRGPISRFRSARRASCAKAPTSASSPIGAVVHRAEVAAAQLDREGVSVEIIDLRSLSPFDWEAIAASVQKTNRVIVAYEDMLSWGYGAEIAARIADELFDDLDAPVRRVAAMDTFCAYQPKLEDEILPQTEDIVRAVRDLSAY